MIGDQRATANTASGQDAVEVQVQASDGSKDAYPRTTDLAEMQRRATPATLAFYAYWDGKRQGRRMPSRADLDPIEMVAWLTNLQLLDVFENPRRLRYRLVGGAEIETRGFNPTGRWVEEGFIGVSVDEVLRNYNIVIDQQCMLFEWGNYPCGGGYLLAQQTIFLPLSRDGATVDKVITFSVVTPR
jgi:hypothetical protein